MAPFFETDETTLQLTTPDHQLRVLAEAIPQMVWTSDAKGLCQYANKRWYDYTGLSYDETRNLQWMRIIHPEDLEMREQAIERSTSCGRLFYECTGFCVTIL